MKKLLTILILLFLPTALAIDLTVQPESSYEVMVTSLERPTISTLEITNNGEKEKFYIYNLLGFVFEPTDIQLGKDETKTLELSVFPRTDINYKGFYTITYYIRDSKENRQEEELVFKMVELEDIFEIGASETNPDDNSITVYIKNKEKIDLGEVKASFKSAFFEFEKNFNLGPEEREEFQVELNKEDFKKLVAGFYTISAEIEVEEKTANVEGTLKFLEKDILKTERKDSGFFINTILIKKTNEGNTLTSSETVIKKNIFSRLFTTMSPEPDIVQREGAIVYYTWERQVKPGEVLEIKITTNWLFPFLVIFFVVTIFVLAKKYSEKDVILRKKVSFVRAKGGEFALQVSIFVSAKKYVENVSIIDRLPPLVKIYEKFGTEQPKRFDEKTKRIEWEYQKLEAGEVRMLKYVIYSKVGVLGRFALPSAKAIYEKEGNIKETESNKAFFVAEQKSRED